MVFKEDLEDLYFAFNDRLEEDGKDQKIIKCKICCLEVPSHSTRSEICEMCFDVDFWEHQEEIKLAGSTIMWAIKVIKSGIIGNCYYATDHYWAGRREDGVASLGSAVLYPTKKKAEGMLRIIKRVLEKSDSKELPKFKLVQVRLVEV